MPRLSKKKGDVRLSGRTTHTHARLVMRDLWWEPIKRMMQRHFLIPGAKHRMAQITGIADSQLHCYSCPDCEHDQEPTFSTGMTIAAYLANFRWKEGAVDVAPRRLDSEPYTTVGVYHLLTTLRTGLRSASAYTSSNRINLNKYAC